MFNLPARIGNAFHRGNIAGINGQRVVGALNRQNILNVNQNILGGMRNGAAQIVNNPVNQMAAMGMMAEMAQQGQGGYNQGYNQPNPGYGQQNNYNQGASFGQQNNYNQPTNYGQQNNYNQPTNYGQQNNYNQPTNYGQQNNYNQGANFGQPGYNQAAPGYGAANNNFNQPNQGYNSPNPGYGQQNFNQQPGNFGTIPAQPGGQGYNQPNPGYGQQPDLANITGGLTAEPPAYHDRYNQPQPQPQPQPQAQPRQAAPAPMAVPQLRNPAQKGQKVALNGVTRQSRLKVCFGWNTTNAACDVDVSAFLLGANGKVPGEDWFVFYGQSTSPDRSVAFQNDGRTDRQFFTVDLARLNPNVTKIVFVLTINEALQKRLNFSMMKDAYIRILDQNSGQEYASFQMTEYYSTVTSMMIGEIYLHNNNWKFNAIGNGVAKDLAGLCSLYGVETM